MFQENYPHFSILIDVYPIEWASAYYHQEDELSLAIEHKETRFFKKHCNWLSAYDTSENPIGR